MYYVGLGKQEQGINTCLQVEKTSKRGGKIINQDKGNVDYLRWPEPIYMRVGYVLESRFSAGKI